MLSRRSASRIVMAVAAVLLALLAAGCGSGSSSTTNDQELQRQPQAEQQPKDEGTAEAPRSSRPEAEDKVGAPDGSAPPEPEFQPKPHRDSGGGSEQFRMKGGDNSIQEFGAEAPEDDLSRAAEALHNFLDARVAGAWAAACSYLSAEVREQLEQLAKASEEDLGGGDCPTVLAAFSRKASAAELRAAAVADVGSLRIEDGRAFLLYTGAKGATYVIPMVEEAGDWKLQSMAGTQLS